MGATGAAQNSVMTTGNLSLDVWNHIVFIANESEKSIYINGYYNNSFTDVAPASANDDNFYIGAYGGDGSGRLDYGLIDSFRIYNYSLDGNDVFNLYEKDRVNVMYDIDYNNRTIETDSIRFTITLNTTNQDTGNISGTLYYNYTNYALTKVDYTNKTNLTVELTIPKIGTTNETYSLNFNYTDHHGNNFTSYSLTQQIYQQYIDDCGGITNTTTLNISFKDSASDSYLTGLNLEANIKYWNYLETSHKNFSLSKTDINNSIEFCIYPNWASYISDYNIFYNLSGYDNNYYDIDSATLNNVTTNLTLYLTTTGDTTAITITIQDDFGEALQDYVVEAYKYDLGDNAFTLVGTKITDSDGQAVLNLDTTYEHKFVIKDGNGNIKLNVDKQYLVSTSYTFYIVTSVTESPWENLRQLELDLQVPPDHTYIDNWQINFTWSDPNSLATQFCLNITNSTIGNPTSVYGGCGTGTSGTLTYTLITTNVTDGYWVITAGAYSSTDGRYYMLRDGSIHLRPTFDVWDSEGLFLAFMFIGTITFLGVGMVAVAGPQGAVASILLMLVGMLVMRITGFFNISMGMFMFVVVMGVVVIGILTRVR